MSKIIIGFWSQSGNTEAMANAIGEGVAAVGKEVEVLFEDQVVEEDKKYFKGHTQNYILVKYETDENLENTLKSVKIKSADVEHVNA